METSPLDQLELEAAQALLPHLRNYYIGTMETAECCGSALSLLARGNVTESTISAKVAIGLLVRLGNELRCVSLLSMIGMPSQAISLASGVLEFGYALAVIAGDNDQAARWVDHKDPKNQFMPAYQLVEAAVARLHSDDPAPPVERVYRDYRQLCMGKHDNPLYAKVNSLRVEGSELVVTQGPMTDDQAIRVARFACERSMGSALVGLASLANNEPVVQGHEEFATRVRQLFDDHSKLRAACAAEYGTDDPYPDRW